MVDTLSRYNASFEQNDLSPRTSSFCQKYLAAANVPPEWSRKFLWTPLVGGYLNILSQVSAYNTSLEDNADFIAQDLLEGKGSQWIYQKVGVKEKRK